MFILLAPLAVLAGFIVVIVKLIRAPKPPTSLGPNEFYWWYFQDGWKEAQRLEELQRQVEEDKKDLHNEIREYLKSGQKMEAIKAYKDYYECSLSKAKTAISEIEWELEYERLHEREYPREKAIPAKYSREQKESLTKSVDRYIEKCIKYGKKDEAIEVFRENYPCNLEEAKEVINQVEFSLQRRGATRYTEEEPIVGILGRQHRNFSIVGMEGHQFEHFCADLLRKVGFVNVSVTPGSGDQGVDVLAEKDGVRYAIQCKSYSSPLGNTPVQEVNAGKTFYNCHVGVVMTNSVFTRGAEDLARATGVLLWDRVYLERLMEQAGIWLAGEDGYDYESELAYEPIELDDDDVVESTYATENTTAPRLGKTIRKGMHVWAIVCYVLAIIYGLIAIDELEMLVACIFFGVLGAMFSVLKRTPKGSPYILGAASGIATKGFVWICIIVAFVLSGVIGFAVGA